MSLTDVRQSTESRVLQTKLTSRPTSGNPPNQSGLQFGGVSNRADDFGQQPSRKRPWNDSHQQQQQQQQGQFALTQLPASFQTGTIWNIEDDSTAPSRGRANARGRGRGGQHNARGRGGRGGLNTNASNTGSGSWKALPRDRSPDDQLWTRIGHHIQSFDGDLLGYVWMQTLLREAHNIYAEWTKEHATEGLRLVDLLENWAPCVRQLATGEAACGNTDCAYGHKFIDILVSILYSLLKHPDQHRLHPSGPEKRNCPSQFSHCGRQLCLDWNLRFATSKWRQIPEPASHIGCFTPEDMNKAGFTPPRHWRIHSLVVGEEILLAKWSGLEIETKGKFLVAMRAIGFTDQDLGIDASNLAMMAALAQAQAPAPVPGPTSVPIKIELDN